MRLWNLSFLALLLIQFPHSLAEPAAILKATAVKTAGVKIDGILETEWLRSPSCDSFTQVEPDGGQPATQPTRAYILYDDDALCLGFLCLDSAPDSIHGRVQRRDNDGRSDYVDIFLDTFHDHRNGYWFTVTAAGVQAEGTVINEQRFDNAWDAVWESAVARHDSGWTVEVRIPFHAIRHGGSRDDGWGINLARMIYRRKEHSFWQPPDPEYGLRVSEFGNLLGLQDISSAGHVEILPHAVGQWSGPSDGDWQSENEIEDAGIYVKFVPGASWTADFAYQPDFAQVDVDNVVINLSDYPVFLEEKRPFFLDIKSLFDQTLYTFFYTRRITDPDYVGRVSIRQNRFEGTAIAGKNRHADHGLQDTFAGRGVWNIGRVSSIGVTSTYLQHDGFHAGAVGVDSRIRWGKEDRLYLWGAAVDRTGTDEQPVEGRIALLHDWGFVRTDVAATYRGKDYDINDLGWGGFSDLLMQSFWIGRPFLPKGTSFQRWGFDANGFHRTLTKGGHDEGRGSIGLWGGTRANWWAGFGFEWGVDQRRNYVDEDEIGEYRDNFGRYNFERYPGFWHWIWLESDSRKSIDYGFNANYGTYRDGNRIAFDPYLTFSPRSNLQFTANLDWRHVWDARDDDEQYNYQTVDFRVWRFRTTWSPSLNITLRGTLQLDEESDDLLTNAMLGYNWLPGSWFYVVYDESSRDSDPLAYNRPGDRALRAKLTYFFTAP